MEEVKYAEFVIMPVSTPHSIAVGNMLFSKVKIVCARSGNSRDEGNSFHCY
ncbi:hypothetical protein ACFL0D_01905 [Thermoproteota archaeon]